MAGIIIYKGKYGATTQYARSYRQQEMLTDFDDVKKESLDELISNVQECDAIGISRTTSV